MSDLNALKKETFERFLREEENVYFILNAQCPEVVVPAEHQNNSSLVLQAGYNFPIHILDLLIDDEAISATLSFNKIPFWCFVPWEAIQMILVPSGRCYRYENNEVSYFEPEEKISFPKLSLSPPPRAKSKTSLKLPSYIRVIK